MNMLRRAWLTYQHMILDPIRADRIQRRETRRAFYAGAQAVFGGLLSNLTPEGDPQPADLEMFTEVHKELEAFAEAAKSGRA